MNLVGTSLRTTPEFEIVNAPSQVTGPADRKILRRQGLARKTFAEAQKIGIGNCDLDHKRKGSPGPILRAIQ